MLQKPIFLSTNTKTILQKSKEGFTFLEIMIVVIIMASLAAIVGQNLFSRVDEANQKKVAIEMKSIESALEFYRLDTQTYPSTEEGLKALIEKPENSSDSWNGPYLKTKKMPLDAWSYPYQYENNGASFKLWSYGSDHKKGGTGVKKDIYNK